MYEIEFLPIVLSGNKILLASTTFERCFDPLFHYSRTYKPKSCCSFLDEFHDTNLSDLIEKRFYDVFKHNVAWSLICEGIA